MGKRKCIYLVLSAIFVHGLGALTSRAWAVEMPTSCEGIDNCAVINDATGLADFFENVPDSGFVTREGTSTLIIGGDFTMAADYYIEDVDLSIYLGDHTVTMADYSFLFYDSNVSIYGKNGTLTNEADYYAPLYIRDGSDVIMNGGIIRGGVRNNGESAIIVDDGSKFTLNSGKIYGERWVVSVFDNSEFIMNGGDLTTTGPDSIAVSGNGTNDPTKPNYGANAKITLNAGTITSNDLGVYAPQVNGVTTLSNDLIIDAKKCGVEVRAGTLNVNGATINVDEEAAYDFNSNNDGSTATGVAIAVAQHTTRQEITVNVEGGTFTAPVAFAENNPQNNGEEDIAKVKLAITGGEFNATNGEPVVTSEDVEKFISGGTFNKEVNDEYLADGYTAYEKKDSGYIVLKTVDVDSDNSASEGDSAQGENEGVLRDITTQMAGELVARFDVLADNDIIELENGSVFKVTDADGVRLALLHGATLSANLYLSEEISDDDVALNKAIINADASVLGSVDYSVVLGTKIDGVDYNLGYFTELSEPLVLVYDVSDVTADVSKWQVARAHNGSSTVLEDVVYDEDAKTLSITSDLFSVFTIAYVEAQDETIIEVTTNDENSTTTPDTGTMTAVQASAMSASIVTAIAVGVITSVLSFCYLMNRRSQE